MSRHDPMVRMRHMLDYAREAVAMAAGRERADLDTDRMLALALSRLVEIIGEAAAQIPHETRAEHRAIPWPQIVGMRNRLIHGYEYVDYDVVWDTTTGDLPVLIAELEKAIAEREAEDTEVSNDEQANGQT